MAIFMSAGVSKARCTPNPCRNEGTCTAIDKHYECTCAVGYMGRNCEGMWSVIVIFELLCVFIVNVLKWLWNPSDFFVMFLLDFLSRRCATFNSIPIILNLLTNRNIALIYLVIVSERKKKKALRTVQGPTGSIQHEPQQHRFHPGCFRFSQPVSSSKYGVS